MKHLTVMGLDISPNSTGWAVGNFEWDRPKYGRWQPPNPWSYATLETNAYAWETWIVETIQKHGVDYVGMEAYIVPPDQFSEMGHMMMWGMHWGASLAAFKVQCKTGHAQIQTWRKHFLGGARAPGKNVIRRRGEEKNRDWFKQEAIRKCIARNWWTDCDDTAEALAVMDCILFSKDDDWAHKYGPFVRRAEVERFNEKGEAA